MKWDEYDDPLPAQILLLFKLESGVIENYNTVGDNRANHRDEFLQLGKCYAVVQTVNGDAFNYRGKQFHLKSNLAVRHTLETDLHLIEIDYIVGLTFVVINNIGSLGDVEHPEDKKSIIMFKERRLWKELFLEL